mgnify:FL=1
MFHSIYKTFFGLFFFINLLYSFEILNNINFGNYDVNLTEIVPNVINDKVLILYGSELSFPSIKINEDNVTTWYDNGLPQLANYSNINASIYNGLLQNELITSIPSNYSDIIVLDFEDWTPVWDTIPDLFKNATINYTQKLYPGLSPKNNSELLLRARQSWEQSSMEVMLYALQVCREVAPMSKIGYYGFF